MRKLTVAAMALVFALVVAAPAFAALGDTIPHGGYSTATDSCLQCHDMHEAEGDYVLMRESTVTEVCATCHTLYQQAPTGAYIPPFSGAKAGEVPLLEAYKVDIADAQTHYGHRLGLGNDIIPGGSQGLTAIAYLGYDEYTVPSTTFAATNGLYCASCHTPHGEFGQMMDPQFSTALLSSKPNHIDEDLSYLTDFVDDFGTWCGACHDLRASTDENRAAGIYNHPDYACIICHGDYYYDPTDDFPHTSNVPRLMYLEPDELCIECHTAGLLP